MKAQMTLTLEKRDFDGVKRFFHNLFALGVMDHRGVVHAKFDFRSAACTVEVTKKDLLQI